MNGVRRLFDGAISAVSTTQTTSVQNPPPPNITPLIISSGKQTWPPTASPVSARPYSPSPPSTPGGTITAGAFFAKRKPVREGPDAPPNPSTPTSPTNRTRTATVSKRLASAAPPLPTNLARLRSPPVRSQSTGSSSQNLATVLNTRDELLMSLLTSEAVVDCRDYEVLPSETVEDLKKEEELLNSRMVALNKKLSLETKIRDAAMSLSRLNATHKRMSKTTSEQVEVANRKVDAAQKDLSRIAERANEVQRRLLEHRAGILSFSVRTLEQQLKPAQPTDLNGGRITPARSREISPTSTGNSISTTSRTKFEGAHLFAGHADAVIPKLQSGAPANQAQLSTLEEKLRIANDALEAAQQKEADMLRNLARLRQDRLDAEKTIATQLQGADETISQLEMEVARVGPLEQQVRDLLDFKARWERDKRKLEEQLTVAEKRAADSEQKIEEVQQGTTQNDILAQVKEARRLDIEKKDAEIKSLRVEHALEISQWAAQKTSWEKQKLQYETEMANWDLERAAWQQEKDSLSDEKLDDLARLQQEMEEARESDAQASRVIQEELGNVRGTLRNVIRSHGIRTNARDSEVSSLAAALASHMESMEGKLQTQANAQEGWEATRRKLEQDFRVGMETRERLGRDLEDARREREETRKELRVVEERLREQSDRFSELASVRASPAATLVGSDVPEDYDRIMTSLRNVWMILPSVEARAAKMPFNNSKLSAGGMPLSPLLSPRTAYGADSAPSISDLDVRALKSLYDPRTGYSSPTLQGDFSIDSLVSRIHALVADDRAVIERLIRFAQAHDLLKSNAERAQKLAQESSLGLDTYSKQVKALEERNNALISKQTALMDEVAELRDTVVRLDLEKRDFEVKANEQAQLCRSLTDANNTLSARTLTLAEEAATAPEAVRVKMEAQLSDLRNQLADANSKLDNTQKELAQVQDELEIVRKMEQGQLNALMDELNSIQTENTALRNQLRAVEKKK